MFGFARLEQKIDTLLANQKKILAALGQIEKGEHAMSLDLTQLQQQVQANTDAEKSAVEVIQKIATELQSASGDQQRVNDLATQLQQSAQALGTAIVANTTAQSGGGSGGGGGGPDQNQPAGAMGAAPKKSQPPHK